DRFEAALDEWAVERVVANLVSNAVKFTPRGGRVDVELTPQDSSFDVVVRDTGIGIDAEFKKRIFGRFEQAGTTLQPGTRGSGIGLWMVRELVEAHGGTVSVESPKGGGAIFRVRLPVAARAEVAATAADAAVRLRPDDFGLGGRPSAPPTTPTAPTHPDATLL